jgi:hypothetical protein
MSQLEYLGAAVSTAVAEGDSLDLAVSVSTIADSTAQSLSNTAAIKELAALYMAADQIYSTQLNGLQARVLNLENATHEITGHDPQSSSLTDDLFAENPSYYHEGVATATVETNTTSAVIPFLGRTPWTASPHEQLRGDLRFRPIIWGETVGSTSVKGVWLTSTQMTSITSMITLDDAKAVTASNLFTASIGDSLAVNNSTVPDDSISVTSESGRTVSMFEVISVVTSRVKVAFMRTYTGRLTLGLSNESGEMPSYLEVDMKLTQGGKSWLGNYVTYVPMAKTLEEGLVGYTTSQGWVKRSRIIDYLSQSDLVASYFTRTSSYNARWAAMGTLSVSSETTSGGGTTFLMAANAASPVVARVSSVDTGDTGLGRGISDFVSGISGAPSYLQPVATVVTDMVGIIQQATDSGTGGAESTDTSPSFFDDVLEYAEIALSWAGKLAGPVLSILSLII